MSSGKEKFSVVFWKPRVSWLKWHCKKWSCKI